MVDTVEVVIPRRLRLYAGHRELVELLLKRKADPGSRNKRGELAQVCCALAVLRIACLPLPASQPLFCTHKCTHTPPKRSPACPPLPACSQDLCKDEELRQLLQEALEKHQAEAAAAPAKGGPKKERNTRKARGDNDGGPSSGGGGGSGSGARAAAAAAAQEAAPAIGPALPPAGHAAEAVGEEREAPGDAAAPTAEAAEAGGAAAEGAAGGAAGAGAAGAPAAGEGHPAKKQRTVKLSYLEEDESFEEGS